MMLKVCAVVAAALMGVTARAYQVTATVTDTLGESLPYVTYRIFTPEAEKALVSAITTDAGVIDCPLDSAGSYRMELSYTGMSTRDIDFTVSDTAPVAALGSVVMDNAEELRDITVTAQRPLVVRQIDRIGYDVQSDPETPTASVRDILRKVPMVSVDADGTIKVNGSTNFKIYKNGRPSNSLSRNAKELFAALPASMIKRIEVITEPGAEFDAEGTSAILNIVTDSNASIKGVLGSASVRWSTLDDAPGANVWMTTEIDKVTFNVYGGYQPLGKRSQRGRNSSVGYFPDGSQRHKTSQYETTGNLGFFGFDGSYQPDTLNLFTAELSGYAYDADFNTAGTTRTYAGDGTLLNSFRSYDPTSSSYLDFDANFNYQHNTRRPGETITVSYLLSHTNQKSNGNTAYSDLFNMTLPYTGIDSRYNLDFFEHTFQGDYTRQMGIHSLSAGVKAIMRRNHSTNHYDYIGNGEVDNEFKHYTDVAAAYAQYSVKLGQVMLRGGLRYEYSHLKATFPDGKDKPFSSSLNDLVPSAAVSWHINDGNSLAFNFSTTINRPGISYLNPAVSITPTSRNFGNPDLGSAVRRSMKLTYTLISPKLNVEFSTGYNFVNNGIAQVQYLEENNIIAYTYANIGHQRTAYLSAFMRWAITSKTSFMTNIRVDWDRYTQNGMELSRWGGYGYARFSQQLPWKLSADAYLSYWAGSVNDVYSYNTQPFCNAWHGIDLRRSFLPKDRLTVSVGFQNPLGRSWSKSTTHTVNGDYTALNTSRYYRGFHVRFSVSYRFGNLQSQVKKAAHTIENDDLVGRKSE